MNKYSSEVSFESLIGAGSFVRFVTLPFIYFRLFLPLSPGSYAGAVKKASE